MCNRSFEMIISIIAVLKSGGAYIPIDPEYPQDRIDYMLNNSNAKFLLTFNKLKDKVKFEGKIFVELDNSKIYSTSCVSLKCINKPIDSSYIIYTSGSTGLPKGVVLTHKALSNLTNYCNNYVEYLRDDTYRTIVSVTTVSFDIFIFETLISLQHGLKLVIANEDEQNIPRLLNKLIEKHNITIIQTTPARMQIFVNNYNSIPALKNLDYITLAGEQLPITLATSLKKIAGCKIYNGYGPSETTVFSTLTDVTDYDQITIGKPLYNTDIYILDKNLKLVPVGCVGEIYIAGDGLGKGYLNRKDLTEKSFIPNPFVPGTLMYKTGDLGCFRPDGEILCLGRSDNQVKIRGLRIELEEIEHKILDNKNIENCVVAKQIDENSHEYLCAYYISNGEINVQNLRKELSGILPKYMVPQYFMELKEFPYTPNGKINRKLLPKPKQETTVKAKVAPRSELDLKLKQLLEELLNEKEISMKDSFFDLGGDSLTAINLCTAIYDSLSVQISVKDILEHPVLMELSDIIASKLKTNNSNKFMHAPIFQEYPVSFAQRGVYYSSVIAGNDSTLYNIPGALLLDKLPSTAKLQSCLQKLIDRHDILRTYFEVDNEVIVQKIKDKIDFKLEVDTTPINVEDINSYFNNFVKPFDLSSAPLLRAKIVKIINSSKYKAMLLIDVHHIVCDGTSLSILTDELCHLYNDEKLPDLNFTFKDFAWTEHELLNSKDFEEAQNYWVSQFENDIPVLEMPTNFSRPASQSFDGNKIYCHLDSNLTNKIENICKSLEITPYMFYLAAYFILLHNYTSQDDIVIGSPITGRYFAETSNLIGMFVNTLPIRMNINSNNSIKEFLEAIKDRCFNNYKYQSYPFEKLVNELNIKRDTSRNPIFDTIFTFQNTDKINSKLGDINAEIYSNDINISKFDLSLEVIPDENGYNMIFEYCTKLFTEDFIKSLSNNYINTLEELSQNINILIKDIKTSEFNIVQNNINTIKNTTKNISNLNTRLSINDIDKLLISILQDLLDLKDITLRDSIFDLGGDSLTAINLCTRIYDKFGIEISVREIFEHPVILELSNIIENKTKHNAEQKLIVAPINNQYPASFSQTGIYYASILAGKDSSLYNIPGGLLLEKYPDAKKIQACMQKLIDRHDILRTYFEVDNEVIVQKIKDKIDFKLEVDTTPINVEDINSYFNNFVKPFDLSSAPLLRAKIVKIINSSKYKAMLLIDVHHIVCDGTSLSILTDELCKLYNDEKLPELNFTFKDFAWTEHELLNSKDFEEAQNYWVSQFENDIPVLEMPTNFPRPALQSFDGNKIYCHLDSNITNKIENICKSLEITPYMFYLAVYFILLHNYTSQDDIVVGSPITGRYFAETSNLIGMFVNTLPIRMNINSNNSIKEFLEAIKDRCFNNYKYQSYPFEKLVNELNIKRDTSRNPIFDTIFTFQNTDKINTNLGDINATVYSNDINISKFDLSLEVTPDENGYNMNFEYCTKLFTEDFIKSLSNHYIELLNNLTDNLDTSIKDIQMLPENEVNKILKEFNNTSLEYPKDSSIKEIFEKQVSKTPNEIAIVYGENDLSYEELNEKANSLAYFLIKEGVQKGDIIPVIMNKSIELIISMLAAIKVGGIYLPITTGYPPERINYILKDTNAKLVLTTTSTNLVTDDTIKSIFVNNFEFEKNYKNDLDTKVLPNDILYIIYTSGSTGNPKGAKISNKNLCNLISSFTNMFGKIDCQDKCLSSTNISFDVSIWEFFITLLNGATLYLYEEDSINDILKYCRAIVKNNITMLYIPPNILDNVYSVLSTYNIVPINKLLIGVEPIINTTIKKYYSLNPEIKIINGYGPTETTVCATACELSKEILKNYKVIPLGKPLNNLRILILNKDGNLVPVGVPGEIYISGDGVGKGYLNNKELTEKSFVELHKFNYKNAYKTGDIAKWNEDGTISFIGRKDFQVKVNGHRIELGEIENCIYQYPDIEKVVVVLDNDKRMIAYLTSSKTINITNLRAFMQRKLPNYFIPNFIVQVDKFKLTSNGKVDLKALRSIKLEMANNYEEPHTKFQKQLVKLFMNVLKLEKIGINDNFFELGGDSLSAIKLQIEAFNKGLELSYKDIFDYPTIKQLSENISKDAKPIIEENYDYSKINDLITKNYPTSKLVVKKDKVKNILLTGATGYIGSHIIDNLLKNTRCNIYCLIRAKSNTDPQTRLLETLRFYFGPKYEKYIFKRIFAVEGDITDKQLGLTDMYYEELGQSISCVINSAAIVKHYGDSNIFHNTNIEGTQNIINFCNKFNCKLVHLSTLSVSGNIFETDNYEIAELSNKTVFSEKNLYIGQDLSNIYIHTKFMAERLILENIINHKLNAKIIRLGNITNRYSDGAFQINVSENAFLNRINSFMQLGCIPDYLLDNYLEFTPVDICADAIVKLTIYKNPFIIFHLYDNHHITFKELREIFNDLKINIDVLSKNEFNKKVQNLSNNEETKSSISGIINDFDKNKKLKYYTNITIKNDCTNKFLKSLSFNWPKIGQKYINKYIIYLKSIGYIK